MCETSLVTEWVDTKLTTLHFDFRKNNALRVVTQTYSSFDHLIVCYVVKVWGAWVIKISELYWLFTVRKSHLLSDCFFRRHDSGFRSTWLSVSGDMTPVSGDMSSGEMTFGRIQASTLLFACLYPCLYEQTSHLL